ncbi:hypothetical protein [Comamonas endophytica]|uniref:Uncharacterized protein n=1 Tax=Comamonas endophytica TaxID=2949090 RepID=A0ABY6G818_9BURK|nr:MULTISPECIES: hypothetical protein [unclassified Acidovorax]MCD2511112.1 hypothetical protein [Acidovorax sp. D4N7]UYG50515.1 hypothetical protein M9799_10420 [Acidovorax sp. 5MLIR]
MTSIPGAAQVQPQIAATSDGHWWISWFSRNPQSAPPGGYGVYLQHLDDQSSAGLAQQGLAVAKLGLSWFENYGLATDAEGNALLAFQDDRSHPPARRITATKISPEGGLLWGFQGVAPSTAAGDQHAPQIAALPHGQAIVGWTADKAVHLQKLDALGRPASQATVLAAPDGQYQLADLQAAGDGGVLVSFVRSRGFAGARHLYANKLDANGELLWGAEHVKVFDGGSLQKGNFPPLLPDGRGGAVFAWYSVAPQMQAHVQHIQADGKPAFAQNGVPASSDQIQARSDPAAAYQPSTGEITLFWAESGNAAQQRAQGLYAQKFDAQGARQWGDTGRAIRLSQEPIGNLRSIAVADGTLAFWVERVSGTPHDSIQAIKLDAMGTALCPQFAVSTRTSTKSRLVTGVSGAGQMLLAWEDRVDEPGSDIYLQSVRADCTLR